MASSPSHGYYRSKAAEDLEGLTEQLGGRNSNDLAPPDEAISTPAVPEHLKLGTFDGVTLPVILNMLGSIMYLRFGFILKTAGLVGTLLLLLVAYAIDKLTAYSIAAISTNGRVKGAGPYYLVSRTLGPEFGVSIGIMFFVGLTFFISLNVLGFIETTEDYFDESFPQSRGWRYVFSTVVLLTCSLVSLQPRAFHRCLSIAACIVFPSIACVVVSFFFQDRFSSAHVVFTGISWSTLLDNLLPDKHVSWQLYFGILFPACTGILGGASLSSDLRNPSQSIAYGTLRGIETTFALYVILILGLAATVTRESFGAYDLYYEISLVPLVVTAGEGAATAVAVILGLTMCGKILQSIAQDRILPILDIFSGVETKESSRSLNNDSQAVLSPGVFSTPAVPNAPDISNAILAAVVIVQFLLLLDDVDALANYVSTFNLLVFFTLNLACCLLRIGSIPNFRPSFRRFNAFTALAGLIICLAAMIFTDALSAVISVVCFALLFAAVNFSSPPMPWGDVSQSIIYHQVRKYLLRLDERKIGVKFWRPQIMLLTNNARHDWNQILFCNDLKKGSLFVLGHVIKGDFQTCLPELHRQQEAWLKLVDVSRVKAFVDLVINKDERDGARQLFMTAGLGGMRPNLAVLGFPDNASWRKRGVIAAHDEEDQLESSVPAASPSSPSRSSFTTVRAPQQELRIDLVGDLPTDTIQSETPIQATTYVGIIEDARALKRSIAIAFGFPLLDLPSSDLGAQDLLLNDALAAMRGVSDNSGHSYSGKHRIIDVWPMQTYDDGIRWESYTMCLQLATILSFVPAWAHHHCIRVNTFVESPDQIPIEHAKLVKLLANLRIDARSRVLSLDSVPSYNTIVHGKPPENDSPVISSLFPDYTAHIDDAFGNEPWWTAVKSQRLTQQDSITLDDLPNGDSLILLGDDHPQVVDEEPENMEGASVPSGTSSLLRRHGSAYGAVDEANSPSGASQTEATQLSFSNVPMRGQLIILNELMQNHTDSDTSLIFTCLPLPEKDCSTTYYKSSRYLDNLALFFDGLPPVLAVYAHEQVVTMSL